MSYFATTADRSHHEIFPGVSIFTLAGQQLMLSFVEFAPGAVVEWHQHVHEQMGVLLEGELEFFIGDEHRVLKPGEMWRIPGGVRHRAIAGPSGVKALDVFHPVRDDYR